MRWAARLRLLLGQGPVFVKVIRCGPRALQRPFLLVAPMAADENAALGDSLSTASTHHEDTHWGIALRPIVDTFQPMVEPAQAESRQMDHRCGPELRLTGIGIALAAVHPRADDELVRTLLGLR